MDDRLAVYLDRMLEAATNALEFTDGLTLAEFLTDAKTKSAVMMCFVIIGEVVGKMGRHSPAFIEDHPDWPWNNMRAMRNVAAHSYAEVEFEQVWQTVRSALPGLIGQIRALGPLDPRDHSGS